MEIGLPHLQPQLLCQVLQCPGQPLVLLADQGIEGLALGQAEGRRHDGTDAPGQFCGHQKATGADLGQGGDGRHQIGVDGLGPLHAGLAVEIVVGTSPQYN